MGLVAVLSGIIVTTNEMILESVPWADNPFAFRRKSNKLLNIKQGIRLWQMV
jgi:hypothetical protein